MATSCSPPITTGGHWAPCPRISPTGAGSGACAGTWSASPSWSRTDTEPAGRPQENETSPCLGSRWTDDRGRGLLGLALQALTLPLVGFFLGGGERSVVRIGRGRVGHSRSPVRSGFRGRGPAGGLTAPLGGAGRAAPMCRALPGGPPAVRGCPR